MRGQDHSGLKRFRSSLAGALLGGMLVFVCGAIYAQNRAPDRAARDRGRGADGRRAGAALGAADHR